MTLTVLGLYAGYGGAPVLREVNLQVGPGTVLAVVGGNGAGKTTLVRTLCGLLAPTAGVIYFDGKDMAGVPVERRVRLGMGCVPEGSGVVEELTVDENLRLAGADRAACHELYEIFEPLAQRRSLAAHHLSGGERRMLAIGRALSARPRVLLLDEPTTGLADPMTARLLFLLRTRADSTGLGVLIAAPQPAFTADRVVMLDG